jgi:4,5-dihydroxyphthalate decarboxylase
MGNIQLTLACGEYDLTRGLIYGLTRPQGVDLIPLILPSPERHWRMTRGAAFDICEFSMASYLAARENELPFTAIPAFPHRRFRHSYCLINTNKGIERPSALRGKRIGLRTWQTTAGVYMRGMMASDYGVPLGSVHWLTKDEESIPLNIPSSIHVERLPAGIDYDELLTKGELDAAFYPELLPSFMRGDPRVRRLWPDSKAEEQAYFERTRVFPIMHTVVIRNDLLDRYPWLAVTLFQAFERAKERAYIELRNPRTVALAWMHDLLDEQRRVLGPDPFAYGIAANHHILERFCGYAHEQGLTSRCYRPEELFHPSTLTEIPKYVE